MLYLTPFFFLPRRRQSWPQIATKSGQRRTAVMCPEFVSCQLLPIVAAFAEFPVVHWLSSKPVYYVNRICGFQGGSFSIPSPLLPSVFVDVGSLSLAFWFCLFLFSFLSCLFVSVLCSVRSLNVCNQVIQIILSSTGRLFCISYLQLAHSALPYWARCFFLWEMRLGWSRDDNDKVFQKILAWKFLCCNQKGYKKIITLPLDFFHDSTSSRLAFRMRWKPSSLRRKRS